MAEVYIGWWDGETIVDWDDANRKVEKGPCLDCGCDTQRWDHLAHDRVCWDCCDKLKRRRIAKAAYAKPEHVT